MVISFSRGCFIYNQIKIAFQSERLNLDYIEVGQGDIPVTTTTTPIPRTGSASFVAVRATAPHGSAFIFTVTPAPSKIIRSAWWSFDYPAHWNTWNSRGINPTFFYPWAGVYSPYGKLTYTDGTTEEVIRGNYIRSI